ncbi:MAG TPA: cytidine deaminase [Firmicutes bacterium]|nr:cytidine deaminase [Bacillota bacterium]
MTEPSLRELRFFAEEVIQNSYSPYSGFRVGALLLSRDGSRTFSGVNVENASYGLTVCAERNALFTAVGAGVRVFSYLYILADGDQLPLPCGACLQVLNEFCSPDMPVTCESWTGKRETFRFRDLLPLGFTFPKNE